MTLSVKEYNRRIIADNAIMVSQLKWFERRAKIIFAYNKSVDKYNLKIGKTNLKKKAKRML